MGGGESGSEKTARPLVRQLRVLAAVAALHRGTPPMTSTLSQVPPSRLEPKVADAPVLWGPFGSSSGSAVARSERCTAPGIRGSIAKSR